MLSVGSCGPRGPKNCMTAASWQWGLPGTMSSGGCYNEVSGKQRELATEERSQVNSK